MTVEHLVDKLDSIYLFIELEYFQTIPFMKNIQEYIANFIPNLITPFLK